MAILTLWYSYIAGGAVLRQDKDSAGVHPGWRNALAEVYTSENWEEGASAEIIHAAQQRLKGNTVVLDSITTDSAAYLNEVRIPWGVKPSQTTHMYLGLTSRSRLQESVLGLPLPKVEENQERS
jgi:hypothetical protein